MIGVIEIAVGVAVVAAVVAIKKMAACPPL